MDTGTKQFIGILVVLFFMSSGFGGYEYYQVTQTNQYMAELNAKLEATQTSLEALGVDVVKRDTALIEKTDSLKGSLEESVGTLEESISARVLSMYIFQVILSNILQLCY